ncbi:hypothetical protein GCM10009117_16070 [Gangjinia marincola]|uniref:Uncharacterized protein n=1 Tax=Gangjinia marincola TaxID=578463 RepID=A0ABN1MH69_9FLAO
MELPSIAAQVGDAAVMLPEVVLGNSTNASLDIQKGLVAAQPFSFSWFEGYLIGVTVMLLLFIQKSFHIYSLYKSSRVFTNGELFVAQIRNSAEAFTFLNTIYMGTQIAPHHRDQILAHEKVHARKKHSFDLLFLEGIKIISWFNPLVYGYQYFLKEVHEFQADALAIQPTQKRSYYETLLQLNFGVTNISFTNTFFNHSFIKKRILMLHKSNTPTWKSLKFAALIPVLALMFFAASCTQEKTLSDTKQTSTELQEEILQLLEENQENLNDRKLENIKSFINTTVNNRSVEVIEVHEVEEAMGNLSVPFSVIEKVPGYPGCDQNLPNVEGKKCFNNKVSTLVQQEFNHDLVEDLPTDKEHRVFVAFKIDKTGQIIDIKARAPSRELGEEAERVIALLPKMTPGTQRGQAVDVLYSLPIVLQNKE